MAWTLRSAKIASGTPMHIDSFPKTLRISGLLVWLGFSAITLIQTDWRPAIAAWVASSLLFAASFWLGTVERGPRPVLLVPQGLAIVVMVFVACNGYEGFLLVLMAAQLGYWSAVRKPLLWLLIEAAALAVAISFHWSVRAAVLLAPPYLAFGVLMFAATRMLTEERRTRAQLAATNDELTRAQSELKRAARLDERLRITQSLHDSLGHHLTALSLSLEAAAHESAQPASGAVRTAQGLARDALHELRALVKDTDDERPIDLEQELQQLARDLPRPRLHVQCSLTLAELLPEVARLLLQSIQEVTTNAIRHGAADNLWIDIHDGPNGLEVHARDDGRGTASIRVGFGLAGIQRRVAGFGGTVGFRSEIDSGFEVHLEVPRARVGVR